MTDDEDSAVLEHKMGWCFSCDTNECAHIQNANAELRAALQGQSKTLTCETRYVKQTGFS